MAISKQQIMAAENAHLAWQKGSSIDGFTEEENHALRNAALAGSLKWTIIDGTLVPLVPGDEGYDAEGTFNTPREAEHFTAGYGKEPGRGEPGKLIGSILAPLSQHQMADKVRVANRSRGADAAQDIISDSRYALPVLTGMARLSPVGGGLAAAGAAGLIGGANAMASAARNEPWYSETPENIGLTALGAAAGAAGNQYFKKENVRDRQLANKAATRLGISARDIKRDKGLLDEIRLPLEAKSETMPEYKVSDWAKRPVTQFDAVVPNSTPLVIDRLPYPKDKGSKILSRKAKSTAISDEIAMQFINELGIDRNAVKLDDVKQFLQEAWLRPFSDLGSRFYPTKATAREFPKSLWVAEKTLEPNEFAKGLYDKMAHFEDPAIQKQWEAAKAKYTQRRRKTNNSKRTLVTPAEYERMGNYGPTGSMRAKVVRPGLRGAATILLPVAAEALGKYVLPKVVSNE